ncbi:MAG: TIGR01777 family oxidoreductase [Bacteroidetes bacterium]|nr:TIGR01777 family oxidoreductase [Bacteroidota bacterium]
MPTVLISGGTGLIGTNLTRHLLERNYQVIILTRDKKKKSDNPGITYSYWNVKEGIIDEAQVNTCDCIIHLAGAGVMDKKWTAEYKKIIAESRTASAALILSVLRKNRHQVKCMVSASAIGWYGSDDDDNAPGRPFIEDDLPSSNFLGETCVLWEASVKPVEDYGVRLVKLRSGIVFSNDGGAFPKFKNPLRFGVATIFGRGKQIISWIHIDDLCRMYIAAIENIHMKDSYNAVAPNPLAQKALIISLAKKIRGRFYTPIHIPHVILKIILGKRSLEILKSTDVSCRKIKSTGFTFLYPTLEAALEQLD